MVTHDNYEILKGNIGDLTAIIDLYLETYRDIGCYGIKRRKLAKRYLKWLYNRCPEGFYVAYYADKIVGFIFFDANWYSIHEGRVVGAIHELVVSKEHWNKGLGSSLMRIAMEQMPEGIYELWVGCNNSRAIEFYESLGFKIVGTDGIWYRMTKNS